MMDLGVLAEYSGITDVWPTLEVVEHPNQDPYHNPYPYPISIFLYLPHAVGMQWHAVRRA
jgi:hypothetical protein